MNRKVGEMIRFVIIVMIFGIFYSSSCPQETEPEAFRCMYFSYRYYYESPSVDYDVFPFGYDYLVQAFKEANIILSQKDIYDDYGNPVPEDIYPPNEYPPEQGDLFIIIQYHYGQYPDKGQWYLEGGIQPAEGCGWAADTLLGITIYPRYDSPLYQSFSLVFVGRIRNEFSYFTEKDAEEMMVIHEMGHQIGHLSYKGENPDDHVYCPDPYAPDYWICCCAMGAVHKTQDGNNDAIVCKKFCTFCVDSLKKVNWQ